MTFTPLARPIGIGVLGFAHGHVAAYLRELKRDPDAELVAGWDDDPSRAEAPCAEAGMRRAGSMDEVLADPAVQAVIVCSETSRHAAHVVAAARAGKHILCQKPMALSLPDCDAMITAADQARVQLALAFQMRCDPANRLMRDLVLSGELGRVGIVRRRHCIGALLQPEFLDGPSRWHVDPALNLGMVMDDATHAADWLHWMLGRPVSVFAEIGNVITDCAPDDTGIAVFRFENGAIGEVFNCSAVQAGENTTEIYGSRGMLVQNYGDGPSCSVPRPAGAPAVKLFRYGGTAWQHVDVPIPPDQGARIRAVPRPWLESLLRGTAPPATGEDGRIAVAMMLGAYESARSGRRIALAP